MPVAARLWYRNFDSCEPIAGQSLPTCCVDGQKQQAWELEGAVISRGVRAAYREQVAANLAKGATLGEINTSNPPVPEDPQPMQCPALLADVVVQWHL